MRKGIWLVLTLAFILVGCGKSQEEKENMIRNYLENKGYKVISYEGNVGEYTLTKKKLIEEPYMSQWGVQKADPNQYIGKTILVEKCIIQNHLLDHWELRDKEGNVIAKSQGKTQVLIFFVDDQIIGGVSYPVTEEVVLGQQPLSLDGETLEEVNSTTFQEWYDRWMEKYREIGT